jgi:hypothetical protein
MAGVETPECFALPLVSMSIYIDDDGKESMNDLGRKTLRLWHNISKSQAEISPILLLLGP